MNKVAITGTGVFTPTEVITNDELVKAFNAYADKYNFINRDLIESGVTSAKPRAILFIMGIPFGVVLCESISYGQITC